MHDHKQCRRLFEKFSEYIDHEMDPSAYDTFESHLQQCEPCQACLLSLKQTVALCREMKTTAMPEDFSRRLRRILGQYS